jgi:RNA polymerase sigma-70 factor, ECF subfamily
MKDAMAATQGNHGLTTLPHPRFPGSRLPESATGLSGGYSVVPLLFGARRGDRQSVGELLKHYRNYLTLLATTQIERRLQRRVSPSDIVQETMLRAHRHFAQFRGQSEKELLGWLRQILLTSLAKFVEQHVLAAKRDVRKEVSIERFNAFDNSALQFTSILRARTETPSALVQHREDAVVLADLLAQLPEPHRDVLVLRHMQGLSFEEVAARMDRSVGATRMLWLRAIEKMREAYRRIEKDGS